MEVFKQVRVVAVAPFFVLDRSLEVGDTLLIDESRAVELEREKLVTFDVKELTNRGVTYRLRLNAPRIPGAHAIVF